MGEGSTRSPGPVVAAACDGACSGNPGPGGWGALLRFADGSHHELGGGEPATTNNRMELTGALALLELLRDLPRHPDLVIRTDSRYLIDGLQKWMPGWKRKGWRTASGGPVLNRDLWEELDRRRLDGLRLQHVRGHSGDPDNDRCDVIAVAFSRGSRPSLRRLSVLPTLPAGGSSQPAATPASTPAPDPAPDPAGTKGAGTKGAASRRAGSTAGPSPGAGSEVASPKDPADASAPDASAPDATAADSPAPESLVRLLGRLELADRLARGGHSLTLAELAQLVEKPLAQLEGRQQAWSWRDWLVRPLGDGRWCLERGRAGLEAPE